VVLCHVTIFVRCDESTQSDYVELSNDRLDEPIAAASRQMTPFDVGSATGSSLARLSAVSRPDDEGRARRSAEGGGRRRRLCGDALVVTTFRSDSSFYHVTFYSNDIFDQTGFLAEYDFRPSSVDGPILGWSS